MTPAPLIARAGCAAIRALVALHPADFRSSFGATVIDETEAEIAAAVAAGTAATTISVARALADAGRGVLAERALQIEAWRKAMRNAFMSDLRLAVRTLARDRGRVTTARFLRAVNRAAGHDLTPLFTRFVRRGELPPIE